MERPEAYDCGDGAADDYDKDAWQEFTPWRPGDPSTAGEAPAEPTWGGNSETVWSRLIDRSTDRRPVTQANKQVDPAGRESEPRGRWWTEEVTERFGTGDRVRSRGAVGGDFMTHVQPNTRGRVTGTSIGALSGEWATVEFDNGYTETVRMHDLKRDSWF